jgi:dipeptidyl aminopeptidase/acylaminoacyl peptidase
MAVTATGECYRLTNAKKSSTNPQWSPDSKRLAFISDRDGKRQIYLIAPNGGEAVQLTSVETGVSTLSWSPDGRRFAFTAGDAESKSRKDRKEKYGEFEVVQADYTFTHLWMIDAPAEVKDKKPEPVRLTEGSSFSFQSTDSRGPPTLDELRLALRRIPISAPRPPAIYMY